MYLQRFVTSLLVLLLFVPGKENSLLSRFRNPNNFVASDEDGYLPPEDLDENLYSDAIREVPTLEEHLQRYRQRNRERNDHIEMPYLKEKPPVEGDYDDVDRSSYVKEMGVNASLVSIATGIATGAGAQHVPLQSTDPMNGNLTETPGRNGSRRWWKIWKYMFWTGDHVGTCYRCGLEEYDIPRRHLCYDAWSSEDFRYRTQARYWEAECYQNWRYWRSRTLKKKLWLPHPHYRHSDRGLRTEYYGNYNKGCFKRWTDVGKVYTQRGCRAHPPLTGRSFAGHRFRRLELTLRYRPDACVHSPHASLTPFARGISLYVRYHVCVCRGRLCNHSAPHVLLAPSSLTHYPLHIIISLYVLNYLYA